MPPPEIFIEFCKDFHQDMFVIGGSIQSTIKNFFHGRTFAEVEEVHVYTEYLINLDMNKRQFQTFFTECGAQIFLPVDHKQFLFDVQAAASVPPK